MTDETEKRLLKEIEELETLYYKEIRKVENNRKLDLHENPVYLYFELKAKLQQHRETKKDILMKIEKIDFFELYEDFEYGDETWEGEIRVQKAMQHALNKAIKENKK